MKDSGKYAMTVITYAEKLSGIFKTDRLQPVYTICLYTGTEPWDGPRRLLDMMEFGEEYTSFRKLFADYPVHLFCVNEQSEFGEFHSELKGLFQAMNCRKDKEKLISLMQNETYAHLSEETWDAIAVMTGHPSLKDKKDAYKRKNEDREEYNMCEALEELINMGREEGEDVGKNKQQCYTIEMMLNKNYDITEICSIVGCDPSLVEKVREEKFLQGVNLL